MSDNHILWPQFSSLLSVAAELGQPQTEAGQIVERAALAVRGEAAEGVARLLTTLAAKPEYLMELGEDSKLAELAVSFNIDVYRKNLDATDPELMDAVDKNINLLEQAADRAAEVVAKGPEQAEKDKDLFSPETTRERGGSGKSPGESSNEDDGDDPSDTPPPNVYGEELDSIINGEKAISIHVIKCDDVTGWGPSGQLDDEIAWHCRSRQKFKDLAEPILAEFTSQEYEDVSSGDRYSAIDDSRSPMAEETKVDIYQDDKLCPRIWRAFIVRGRKVLREDNESAFKLEDFERCRIRITLFEVGETLEGIIEEILKLILHLTGLGVGAGSTLSPTTLIQGALGSTAQNSLVQDSLRRLEQFISQLLGSTKDRIGRAYFRVTKANIESAFAGGTPVATPYGFSYVLGPEQTLTGKDSSYVIQLRYEDHS